MLTDVLAHQYHEDPKLLDEIEDEDFNPDDVARQMGRADDPNDWEELK